MAYRIDTIPNKRGRDTVLLRKYWREGRRIRKQRIATLTDMPATVINGIDAVLRGGVSFASVDEAFSIRRAQPHGHVTAVLGTARAIGLERILDRSPGRFRSLALAAVVSRILSPDSKLATARRLSPDTADSSLGEMLKLGEVSGNEMLSMLDWLRKRQPWIERSLANRHVRGAMLILYDVTSSYLEGRKCPLAAFGHNRDGKKGKMQIVYGLLCAPDGCPVAVEVFSGNTADPNTVASQVHTIQRRFGIERIALVGDRGMITSARIRADLQPAGLDWISALRTNGLRKLLKRSADDDGDGLAVDALEPDSVTPVVSGAFPGETILVCLNARLREERGRKRQELLERTEDALRQIEQSVRRGTLSGEVGIARRVGAEINRWKMAKHFDISITDRQISWRRLDGQIADEARLDGVYAIRTSVTDLEANAAVQAYKSLSQVERAFRTAKSHLDVRPIHVYSAEHVRAHVFLCMLAYHVEWHMRQRLAPLLFDDDDREAARAARKSPVARAEVSDRAKRKAASKHTDDGFAVHSFQTLIGDLSTMTLNHVSLPGAVDAIVPMLSDPTPLQARALDLLGIDPQKYVPSAGTG